MASLKGSILCILPFWTDKKMAIFFVITVILLLQLRRVLISLWWKQEVPVKVSLTAEVLTASHDPCYLKKQSLMEHYNRGVSLRNRFSTRFSYSASDVNSEAFIKQEQSTLSLRPSCSPGAILNTEEMRPGSNYTAAFWISFCLGHKVLKRGQKLHF